MQVSDVTTQFPDRDAIQALIDELKAYADGIATGDIDLSDYVTKSELQAKLDALDINIDLSSYATKEELTNAINSIDLSAYAKTSDIPSLEGYVTEEQLEAKGYLTEHQDLSAYALKTEIPSLDGYATTEYVDNAIANVPSGGNVDLSNYYTKEETDALIPTVKDGSDGKDGADGITPTIDETTKHWMIGETDTGIVAEGINGADGKDGTNGVDGKDGTNGTDGTDGVSPTVTVTKEGSVATITCTDINGTTTATISDGKDGTSSGGSGGGSSEIYSTEETAVGTWIDGKPVYRKTYQLTGFSTNATTAFDIEEDIYEVVSFSAVHNYLGSSSWNAKPLNLISGNENFKITSNSTTNIQNAIKENTMYIYLSGSTKKFYLWSGGWGRSNSYVNVTLEYTKST